MKHLRLRHAILENDPEACSSTNELHPSFDQPSTPSTEEELTADSIQEPPLKKKKQLRMDRFLDSKHTLRSETLRLVCESNFSMNAIVSSATMRRLSSKSYPSHVLPRSGSTLTTWLHEDAEDFRNHLRVKFRELKLKGWSLSLDPTAHEFDSSNVPIVKSGSL